jgi:cytochrome c peroxidase
MRPRALILVFLGATAAAGEPLNNGGACAERSVGMLSAEAELGRRIFFDATLSASGQLSCARCHSPEHAYTSPEGGAAPPGGAHRDRPGLRAVPSLRYLDHTPRFTRHFYLPKGEDREDLGPAGGFMLDGRADSLREQALLPWMDSAEMGNSSIEELSVRLEHAAYADLFRKVFGRTIFDDPHEAVARAALALERFELEDPSFHPYNSRYDQFLAGTLTLTEQELRGLRPFVDPLKGNCAECHPNTPGPAGRPPDFTDYAYRALGVPRNRRIAANANPGFFDLGLCGPRRTDLQSETQYCGYFKTPTLRNAARRRRFFHNARFDSLRQVLRFYAERDTQPQQWYPTVLGRVLKFDDLPARFRDRVDLSDRPFGKGQGTPPALSAAEIEDVLAFLETLDDSD